MCMTSGPAKLSKTKLMCIKVDDDKHLLAYANTVENLSGKPNSMIFPVPGKLSQKDFYDTTKYAKFMEEIEEALKPRTKSLSFGISKSMDSLSMKVENFKLGFYNVFISESASAIGQAISKLPDTERPEISQELLSFFEKHYKGWSFVICCFSGKDKVDAQPIMFTYDPFDKNILFFPGMDSHTGGAPNLGNEKVWMDHFLISTSEKSGEFNFQKNDVPDVLKGRKFFGREENGKDINGDWYNSSDGYFDRHQTVQIKNPEIHDNHPAS